MSDEEGSPTFVVHDFILGMKATGEVTVRLIGDERGTERHFAFWMSDQVLGHFAEAVQRAFGRAEARQIRLKD